MALEEKTFENSLKILFNFQGKFYMSEHVLWGIHNASFFKKKKKVVFLHKYIILL